jgi:hypothetical protein
MQAACHGRAKSKGLSRAQACEYVSGQSPKGLPEKKSLAKKRLERKKKK